MSWKNVAGRAFVASSFAVLSAAVGCADEPIEPVDDTEDAGAPLGDGGIADAAETVNTGAIGLAQAVSHRLQDGPVRRVAVEIAERRADTNAALEKALAERGIVEVPTALGEAEADVAEQDRATLDATADADLPIVYLELALAEHVRTMQLLEDRLVPEAADDLLRDLLVGMREEVNMLRLELAIARSELEGGP